MVRIINWRILTALIAFMLLAIGVLNDFPTTAQAGFISPAKLARFVNSTLPASSQSSISNQVQDIVGRPWQGQKGVVQPSKQSLGNKSKNNLNSARPRPVRLGRSRSTFTGQSASSNTDAAAQAGLSLTSAEPKRAVSLNQMSAFPALDLTFTGTPTQDDIDNSRPQIIPPDTVGAVGPTQFMIAINGLLRVLNKVDGTPEHPFGSTDPDLDSFFSPLTNYNAINYTNFPRVRYDRFSSRWILLVNDVPGGAATLPNRVLLAVSDGPIITENTLWTEYFFQPGLLLPAGNESMFADYPTLGVDANALYIGVNLYTPDGVFSNTAGFVVKKSSILNGGPIVVTGFGPLIDDAGNGPFSPQGVDDQDSSVDEGYFIGVNLTGNNQLQLRRVTDPGGTPTLSASNIPVTIAPTALPIAVPHKGNTGDSPPDSPNKGKLDPLDDRLINAVVHNGSLWTAHNIGVNSVGSSTETSDRDGSRWYEITLPTSQTPSPAVKQGGTVYDASAAKKSYWVPTIMVSGQEHAVMSLNVAGPLDYISAAVTGRLKSDNLNSLQPPVPFIISTSAYNPLNDPGNDQYGRRWGDYSYTSLDPEDNMTFWTIQEFAYSSDDYGIQIAKLKAPPPASLVSVNHPYIKAGQTDVDITLIGNQVNGSGFYDPGAGFPNHLSATIGGNITVNSVSFVSPTTIVLNISAAAATAGKYDVTVTNPDGQSVTGANLINVTTCLQEVTDSAPDGTAGSLREAVDGASSGCKVISLENITSKIELTSSITIPSGVTITTNNPCSAGKVELDGTGVTGDGLILNGGTFFGLNVHGFNGRQIVANNSNQPNNDVNKMSCISASRT